MSKFDIIVSGDSSEKAINIVGENVLKGDIVYLGFNSKWFKTNAAIKLKSITELAIITADALIDTEVEMISFGYFNFIIISFFRFHKGLLQNSRRQSETT